MRTAKIYGLLLASALLAAAPSYASSITGFSITTDPEPYMSNLSDTVTSSEASVTGTVACPSQIVLVAFVAHPDVKSVGCSGEVGFFSLGVDLNEPTEFTVDISGVLSPGAAATGSVDIAGIGDFPFDVSPGAFDVTKTILLPAEGSTTLDGSVDLTMDAGQSIALPLNLSVAGTSAVPEPSGQALLIVGLLGIAGFVRYRFFRAA